MMSVQDRLAQAVCSQNPVAKLSAEVRALVSQGLERESLYAELETLRALLQKAGREDAEDAVLDVMDFLSGFCSPHIRI